MHQAWLQQCCPRVTLGAIVPSVFQEEPWQSHEGCWEEERLALAPGGTLGARAEERLEVSRDSCGEHQAWRKDSCRLDISSWLPLFSSYPIKACTLKSLYCGELALAQGGTLGSRAEELLEVLGDSSGEYQAWREGSCRLDMSSWLPPFSTYPIQCKHVTVFVLWRTHQRLVLRCCTSRLSLREGRCVTSSSRVMLCWKRSVKTAGMVA